MSTVQNPAIAARLSAYGTAAFAAMAGVGTANADLVTLPVNISSAGSVEAFIDILPFALGATTISVSAAYSTFSVANPLAPNSELMLRGVGTGISGAAQLRPQNGAALAAFTSIGYLYVRDVGAPFALPTNTAGTFLFSGTFPNPSLTYPAFAGGDFAPGTTGVAYFQFFNSGTGLNHDGWATIAMNVDPASGALVPTITAIHVDTVPAPGALALLCLGASGVAGYRTRRA